MSLNINKSLDFQSLAQKTLKYRWVCFGMLILTYIFVYFDRVAPAVVAPDLMKDFALTATSLGLLSSVYFYPYAAMQIPAGILSDTIGPRKAVTIFFIIAACGTALFGLAPSYNVALVGRAMMGIGVAVVYLPIVRILGNWFRPTEFSTLLGFMLTAGNAGALLASAPLALLAGSVGWRNSFYYLGVGMVIIAILNWLIVRNKPQDMGLPTMSEIDDIDYNAAASSKSEDKISIWEGIKMVVSHKNYWPMSIYGFVFYGSIMGFQGLWSIPYFTDVFGITKQNASNIIMFWALGMAVMTPLIGFISDKILRSRKKTILIGSCLYILAWLPLVLATGTIQVGMLYPLMFLLGGFCGSYVVITAQLTEDLPRQIMATAAGLINLWMFVGGAVFQQVMGKLLDTYAKVNGHFPVDAYKYIFTWLIVAVVIGVVTMFFTTENTKLVEKKR